MSFFTGFGVSSLVYILLNLAFPVIGASTKFEELDVSSEAEVDDDSGSRYSKEGMETKNRTHISTEEI